MKTQTLIEAIASTIAAYHNCVASGNTDWQEKHADRLAAIATNILPSGGGFDSATTIDIEHSTGDRIVLHTAYHHMNDGYYSGWTHHTIIVTPSFIGRINLRIGGRNRNDIKDYISDVFSSLLTATYPESQERTA